MRYEMEFLIGLGLLSTGFIGSFGIWGILRGEKNEGTFFASFMGTILFLSILGMTIRHL